MFYGEFDAATGELKYVNAGHNYPLLRRRDGELVELKDGGLVLGIQEDAVYAQGSIRLEPGDSLLLYSDGIPEALDAFGQMFGEDRLRDLWQRDRSAGPGGVIEAVLGAVQAFRGRAVQSDDMTLVVLGAPAAP